MSYDIPNKDLSWFKKNGIKIINCKEILNENISLYKGSMNISWTKCVINKFYLFTTFFKKWDNILFLDSDVIVKASLSDIQYDKGLNACLDCSNNLKEQFLPIRVIENKNDILIYKEIFKNFNKNSKAFNSGVIAFSTELIKKNTFNDLIKITKNIKNIMQLGDQTVLNLYFYNNINYLPLVYNNYIPYTYNKNIKSIIIHTPHDLKINRAWEKNSKYYKEWNDLLYLSNYINFNKKNIPKIKLTEKEILINSKKIEKSINKKLFIKRLDILFNPLRFIDKNIGILGIYLKKRSPNTYFKLKKLVIIK